MPFKSSYPISFAFSFMLCVSAVAQKNVGIGTQTPTAPLSFQSVLGKKIVLHGDGNSNHSGIGVQSGFLQFYVADANTKMNFGSSPRGVVMTVTGSGRVGFNNAVAPGERLELNGDMRLRWGASPAEGPGVWLGTSTTSPEPWFVGMVSNSDVGMYYNGTNPGPRLYWNLTYGSMGVNGDVGANGWQLVSAGANAATYWKAPQYYTEFNTLSQEVFEPTAFTITTNNTWQQMTGLAITQNYTRPTKVEAHFNVLASAPNCCAHVEFMVVIDLDGGGQKQFRYYVENGNSNTFNGSMMLSIPAGQHKVSIAVLKLNGADLVLPNTQGVQSSLILQAIPG